MKKCRWVIGGMLALMLLCAPGSSPAAEEEKTAPPGDKAGTAEEAVFKLAEVSLFDQEQSAEIANLSASGQHIAMCNTKPAQEVKAYPKLRAKQPLYGAILLQRDPAKPGPAVRFHFVLDQSGEPEESAEKADDQAAKVAEKKADKKPTLRFDRLYFDLNRDLDLTNDAPVALMKKPPEGAFRWMGNRETASVFDAVALSVSEDQAKDQQVRLLPVLMSYNVPGYMFFMPASARQGEVRLGKKAYKATLLQARGMIGRFDHASSPLLLTPVDGPKPIRSSYSLNTLGTLREADGEFYALSATPTGDQLTVRPYGGERGVFEVSAGKRDVKDLGLAALLRSKDFTLPLGDIGSPMGGGETQVAKYHVPAGDYQPLMLNVKFGSVQASLRPDTRRPSDGSQPANTISIGKDKPYVLDFSGKPEVTFSLPPKDKVFKPGDTIRLSAMLAIPEQKMLLGGLTDMSQKTGEMKWSVEGKVQTAPRYASLDPTIAITDSSGKRVAGGKMPFG